MPRGPDTAAGGSHPPKSTVEWTIVQLHRTVRSSARITHPGGGCEGVPARNQAGEGSRAWIVQGRLCHHLDLHSAELRGRRGRGRGAGGVKQRL